MTIKDDANLEGGKVGFFFFFSRFSVDKIEKKTKKGKKNERKINYVSMPFGLIHFSLDL